ncbi:MAG: hypothetical protein V1875_00190 [Candidatus Altiarchaeota archaeon]
MRAEYVIIGILTVFWSSQTVCADTVTMEVYIPMPSSNSTTTTSSTTLEEPSFIGDAVASGPSTTLPLLIVRSVDGSPTTLPKGRVVEVVDSPIVVSQEEIPKIVASAVQDTSPEPALSIIEGGELSVETEPEGLYDWIVGLFTGWF